MAQRPWELMLENDQLGSVVIRGDREPESPNEEWARYGQYTFMVFNAWEYGYYLDQAGSTPSELWKGVEGYYHDLCQSRPGMVRWWNDNEHSFAEPFRSYTRSHFPAVGEGAR